MAVIIKPEHFVEVLDRLTGANWSGKLETRNGYEQTTVGAQDNMYKFFDRDKMTSEEIKELERHRT